MKHKNGQKNGHENGDLIYYAELLDRSHKDGLKGITTRLIQVPSKENQFTAIVFAKIRTNKGTFTGHGDASPTNVDPEIAPHIIRAAETRAKARALRDAANVGAVAVEELGGGLPNGKPKGSKEKELPTTQERPQQPAAPSEKPAQSASSERPATAAPAPTPNGEVSPALMTDAQKRYLFRLLAMDGVTGDAAQAELKKQFNVDSLKNATKARAGHLIEDLLSQGKEKS